MLRTLFIGGILALPFTFFRRNIKERAILFFFTGYAATFLAQMVVGKKMVKYPVRPMPKYFQTNILYEQLLLPLMSLWFNHTTRRSRLPGIVGQAFLYSGAHTLIEYGIEKKTRLVQWKKWSGFTNICSIIGLLLATKGVLSVIRWLAKKLG